ncbi:LPXTG-domain-containing protein cell wall anchor domain [Bacillus wiedmannii]|nr:LPXTG-domain-containing protein cell wall anchor domain [Bacillus wiedmannii]EJQ40277.1 LPXTG-domain-containing protein cell wall anchor domain [Bacillus wiedmannii]
MERIEKERMIYMQKRKHYMFQKPMKVLATSAILTTTLFTPTITNSLTVQAETVAAQTTNQYEQRDFELPGTGSFSSEAKRERRSEQKTYMPTGIYVKPNEQITIEVSGTQKVRAIIGTHQYDKQWGKEVDLSPGSNTISSPNGGLLGFDNPQDTGTVKVKVTQGGSPVPFFELGKHTREDWITMMNKYPDAHAVQLKSEKAVLTVTRDSAQKYIVDQDPVPLLEKYDEMIRAQDKISGLSETDPNPLHRSTRRIWAFVENPNKPDWGMYASLDGAVFTTAGNAIESALDVNKFGWGQMHEAGHARQQYPWIWNDLRGMTEVTVNLYSLAAQKQLFPNQPTRLEKSGDYDRAFTYIKQTDKDYKNINDLFVKLVMLWQLNLAYGEDFYPNLHKLYRELPENQLPKTDEDKIQAFIYNTSKVAKQNLLPFFDQWGLKASQETRQKIEALNYPILTAPIWEATDSKPVIVEENGETSDMEPKLTVPAGATMNVGDQFDPMSGVSATDKEDGDLTSKVTVDGKVDTTKPGTYVLTYTVKDSKGHKVTAKQTVTVKEKEETKDEAPVLKVPSETTITEGDKFDPMKDVSSTDKEDGDITSEVKYEGNVDTNTPGTYTITYTVKDSAGHLATQTQTITVKEKPAEDNEPELTVPEETVLTVGDQFDPMSGVKAIDKEDGDITSKVTYSGDQGTDKEDTYKIKYVVEDSKGHRIIKLRTVIVKAAEKPSEDQAPVLKVPFTTTFHVGDTFDPMSGVSATDKEDGNLTSKVKYKGNVGTTKPGKYIVEYSVVDSQGVNATATQTVIVEESGETPDMEPKLTVPVGATMNVGDQFGTMSGVSATDKEDGDLTSKVTVDGKVDTTKPGTYVLTYTVKDSAGHLATQTQTVTVKEEEKEKRVEIQGPELTVPSETTVTVGDKFDPMSGVKAIDKEDGDITDKVIQFGEVDTSKTGTYEVKFLVRDSGGNEVTTIQKVVVKDKDNGNNNTNNGNGADNGSTGTNNSNGSDTGNSNISNNSTSDKKEDTYKELPKTGASTNNSAALGILMVLAGMVITFGRKFKKVLK